MISGVLVFNQSAELIISRFYKSDYSKAAVESFRIRVISNKNFSQSPVMLMEKYSFIYVKCDDLILVAMTRRNPNVNLAFEFLYKMIDVFESYFEGLFNQEAIRSNFVLVYELLDEVMDWGYPQIVDTNLLKGYIHHGTANDNGANGSNGKKTKKLNAAQEAANASTITSDITGKVSWRKTGLMYPKNEVYLDVVENVNVIINQSGKVLSSYCRGKIQMKSSLSGMPECRFGLNDKVSMQKRREARGSSKKVSNKNAINLEDVTFHPAIMLSKYDQDKTIMFIPPDGEWELMTYRINKTNLPFEVTGIVTERGRNRVEYHVTLKSRYENFNFAQDITLNIPVPSQTHKCNIKVAMGKWKYIPSKSIIEWKLPKLQGQQSINLKGDVKLAHLIQDKQWARPPISMQFTIPMWPASGLKVRFLNVQEPKMQYKSIKWVRYVTHAGDYLIRI